MNTPNQTNQADTIKAALISARDRTGTVSFQSLMTGTDMTEAYCVSTDNKLRDKIEKLNARIHKINKEADKIQGQIQALIAGLK